MASSSERCIDFSTLPYVEYTDAGNSGLGVTYKESIDGSSTLTLPGVIEVDFHCRDTNSEPTSSIGKRAIFAFAQSFWQL